MSARHAVEYGSVNLLNLSGTYARTPMRLYKMNWMQCSEIIDWGCHLTNDVINHWPLALGQVACLASSFVSSNTAIQADRAAGLDEFIDEWGSLICWALRPSVRLESVESSPLPKRSDKCSNDTDWLLAAIC